MTSAANPPAPGPAISEQGRAPKTPVLPDRADIGPPERGGSWSDRKIIAVAFICFAILSLSAAIRSKGFLESDGGTHFLFARYAWYEPHYLTNVWGRPLCTALFCLPAHFAGVLGVRATSLLMALTCAAAAYAIARGQRMAMPAIAMIFTLGQPLLFLHSFSELTELPFAAVIGLAFLAYQRRNFAAMAILAGLSPLGRPEGFGFVFLAAAALVAHRRLALLALLAVPILVWEYAGWRLNEHSGLWITWLIRDWPYSQDSVYQSGSLFHFFMLLPVITGPLIFPAFWIGAWLSLGQWRAFFSDHLRRCRFLSAALPLAVMIVHSLLFWRGKLASSGELRYLLVTAPLWAVVGTRGWEWAFTRLRLGGGRHGASRLVEAQSGAAQSAADLQTPETHQDQARSAQTRPNRPLPVPAPLARARGARPWLARPVAWAAAAAVLPGLVNYYYRVLPIDLSPNWSAAQRVVQWYAASHVSRDYPRILCATPGVFYFLGFSGTDPQHVAPWTKATITNAPPGTIMFWDPENATTNSDRSRLVFLPDMMAAGWIDYQYGEWKSDVNNPPPWADYRVSNPPKPPKDDLLPDTPMIWHIFLTPEDIQGRSTPAEIHRIGDVTWKAAPLSFR